MNLRNIEDWWWIVVNVVDLWYLQLYFDHFFVRLQDSDQNLKFYWGSFYYDVHHLNDHQMNERTFSIGFPLNQVDYGQNYQ